MSLRFQGLLQGVATPLLLGLVGACGASEPSPDVDTAFDESSESERLARGESALAAPPLPPTCLGLIATIVGSNLPDTIVGGAGNDVIVGLGGDDTIDGGGGQDTICGGDGDDVIDGNGGNDVLHGGRGDDGFVEEFNGGIDTIVYTDSPAGITIDLSNAPPQEDGFGTTDNLDNIENVIGSAFADEIRGNFARNVLEGRGGADILEGAGGPDSLLGGAGDDTLQGGNGDDILDGNAGQDTAVGGPGVDTCTAEVVPNC